ncbi:MULTISPECIES: hypothetical protein [unclassified Actinomadura]|uniref:hypothetical protein n=1 Tax=unclassified Actinomadura TaxID=2626254 RepID=UPI00135705CE|nr:hypothetical protein [Actinomadura sp. K4S16]
MGDERFELAMTDKDRQHEDSQAAPCADELGKAVRERRLELGMTLLEPACRNA